MSPDSVPHDFANNLTALEDVGAQSSAMQAFVVSLCIATMICVLIANGLTFVAVFKYKPLFSSTNVLILSLTVCDFLVGLSVPLQIVKTLQRDLGRYLCLTRTAVMVSFCTASALHLLLIAIDRYIAVVFYVKHRYLTLMQVYAAIIVVWILSFFNGFVIFAWNQLKENMPCTFLHTTKKEYVLINIFLVFIAITVPMLAMYRRIFQVAKEQSERRKKFISSPKGFLDNMRNEVDITKMLALILAVFLVFLLPFVFVNLYRVFVEDSRGLMLANEILTFPLVLNSAANPVIYTMMNRQFRESFEKLFRIRKGSKAASTSEMVTASEFKFRANSVQKDRRKESIPMPNYGESDAAACERVPS